MKNMKKRTIILSIFILFLIAISGFLIFKLYPQKAPADIKQITVSVVFKDKSEKKFEIKTDKVYLADALFKEKIISQKSADGYYTEFCGETADYSADKSWWCILKDGQMTNAGLNDLKLTDGDSYQIKYEYGE